LQLGRCSQAELEPVGPRQLSIRDGGVPTQLLSAAQGARGNTAFSSSSSAVSPSSCPVPETGGTVWFAGLDDLLEMKRAAGRDQDLMDITALRMAHGLEE